MCLGFSWLFTLFSTVHFPFWYWRWKFVKKDSKFWGKGWAGWEFDWGSDGGKMKARITGKNARIEAAECVGQDVQLTVVKASGGMVE